MTIYIDNHPCHYEVQCLCMMFLQGEAIELVHGAPDAQDQEFIYTGFCADGRTLCVRVNMRPRTGGACAEDAPRLLERRQTLAKPAPAAKQGAGTTPDGREAQKEMEAVFGRMLYEMLRELTGIAPQWGILTGIRPVRRIRAMLAASHSEQEVFDTFTESFLVSEEKTRLGLWTARVQQPFLQRSPLRDASLYVSIPFCPTRCKYCSFVSHSIERAGKLVDEYVPLLCEELRRLGGKARRHGLRLRSVYFGGGTPTTLSAAQLTAVFQAIRESFDLRQAEEYTVEAGRPDTITPEKLAALREAGVGRVSVNPQSMQDEVLRLAQRPHTAQDTVRAVRQARQAGFQTINMDLIAGLNGDTLQGFADSVRGCIALGAENITVHTLCVKRAAGLRDEKGRVLEGAAAGMVRAAYRLLSDAGYQPYYLYRQKNTVDNLENTGWCLPGHESLYNMRIMDESQTILAAGAGAVTKLCGADKITRIFAYKYPYEYISRFSGLLARQDGIDAFYENLCRQPPEVEKSGDGCYNNAEALG